MTEDRLRTALTQFMEAAGTKDSGKVALALAEVTQCQQALGQAAHPQLRHYLENRSYQKALEFLNHQKPAAGTCR